MQYLVVRGGALDTLWSWAIFAICELREERGKVEEEGDTLIGEICEYDGWGTRLKSIVVGYRNIDLHRMSVWPLGGGMHGTHIDRKFCEEEYEVSVVPSMKKYGQFSCWWTFTESGKDVSGMLKQTYLRKSSIADTCRFTFDTSARRCSHCDVSQSNASGCASSSLFSRYSRTACLIGGIVVRLYGIVRWFEAAAIVVKSSNAFNRSKEVKWVRLAEHHLAPESQANQRVGSRTGWVTTEQD
jgi:hypothetical protein